MRADSNCTTRELAIGATLAGSRKIAFFRAFLTVYGRVRLPKIFYLK
jgi:hypothetical protein